MLRPPVAFQRFADRLLIRLDPGIAQFCQHSGVALTLHDGIQDRQPRQAGDVGDHVMELHVHLRERLLHVLHVLTGHLDQIVAMAHQ